MSLTQRESAEAAVSLWTAKPVGGQRSKASPGTENYFQDVEAYRYGYETPWIPRLFGFDKLRGKNVLELGVGLGIDGSNIASHGAKYTGVDITQRHLDLAEQNFRRKGLPVGSFMATLRPSIFPRSLSTSFIRSVFCIISRLKRTSSRRCIDC